MAAPRWREVADDLRDRINAGEFAEADQEQQRAVNQLPTEPRLQEQYSNISRNTVRQAIDYLASRHVVEKQAGRGTFVVEDLKRFVSNLTVGGQTETVGYHEGAKREGRKAATSAPQLEIKAADKWLSDTLGIDSGEPVVVRHQRRFIDDRPFSLQTSFYPMSFVKAGAGELLQVEDISGGAMAHLREVLGIEEAGTVDRISARAPNHGETEFFRTSDVVAILVHRRTTYDHDGNPIRVTVTTYPADRNEFEFLTGDVPPRPSTSE